MTSDSPHNADRSADPASTERVSGSSGFGLFEAPSVPDTFPTFTPRRNGDVSSPFPVFGEDETAPATGTFSGFPPDTATDHAAAPASDVYVPAPAVIPIPNPAEEEPSSWTAYSQSRHAEDPAPQTGWAPYATTPVDEPEQPAEQPVWSTFSQDDQGSEQQPWSPYGQPPAAPADTASTYASSGYAAPVTPAPVSPAADEEPAWSAYGQPPADPAPEWTAFANTPPYETPYEAPAETPDTSWQTSYPPADQPTAAPHTLGEQRVPGATLTGSWPAFAETQEPVQEQPPTGWAPHPAPAYDQAPSYEQVPSYDQAPSYEQVPSYDQAPGEAWAAAGVVSEQGEDVELADQAVTPTRASASVPVASRISPPVEQIPANRPAPRVYGSTTRPDAPDDAVQPAEPVIPHQPNAPAAETPGKPVVARASVSVGRVSPTEVGEVPATMPGGVYGRPQSTVYGSPAAAAQAAVVAPVAPPQEQAPVAPQPSVYGMPQEQPTPAPTRGPAMPPYGDLLGPATPAQTPAPAYAPATPQRPGPPSGPGPVPPQRGPAKADAAQERFNSFQPAEETPAPPSPVRSSKVLILVIAACVALLGLAFGAVYLASSIASPAGFAVGDCVKRVGNADVATAQCSEAGAYQVIQAVDTASSCPDPNLAIEQNKGILCLKVATPDAAQ